MWSQMPYGTGMRSIAGCWAAVSMHVFLCTGFSRRGDPVTPLRSIQPSQPRPAHQVAPIYAAWTRLLSNVSSGRKDAGTGDKGFSTLMVQA